MLPEFGRNIRTIRKNRDISMAELAAKTGLTVSHISQIERGIANPSLIALSKLAEALNIPITSFFQEEQAKYTLVRADERKKILLDHTNGFIELLTTNTEGCNFGVYFSHSMSEQLGMEYTPHEGKEFFYIMEGVMSLDIGQENIVLNPGDSILFDSTVPHRVSIHKAPLRTMIVTTAPSSFMDTLWRFLP